MPNEKGQFQKGEHWRPHQVFREKDWLIQEYVGKGRSTGEIAAQFGVKDAAILFWLRKHDIPRRSVSEARQLKHWGLSGEVNGMFGKTGEASPVWKGGLTPERQALQHSPDWKEVSKAVWKRDRAKCQRCGKQCKPNDRAFHVHHRITFEVSEVRLNVDNLVLLCPGCHRWVHGRKNTHRLFLGSFQASLEGGQGGAVLG